MAGDLRLGLERGVVDARGEDDPGDGRRLVELLAGLRPAGPVRHRGVVWELALEDVATECRQAACRAHDDVATVLAAQLRGRLVHGEAERLQEERQVVVGAGLGDLDEQLLLLRGVLRVGVVVEQELDGVGAHALRLGDAPVRQQAADPRRGGPGVAARLDGHDEAGGAGQRAVRDGLGRAQLGIEQDAAGRAHEGAHDGPLDLDEALVGHRGRVVRPEHAPQVVAVIEGQDRQPARVGGAGIQSPHGADPERHRSTALPSRRPPPRWSLPPMLLSHEVRTSVPQAARRRPGRSP